MSYFRGHRRWLSDYERKEWNARSAQEWGAGFFLVVAGALVLWNLYSAVEMANSQGWSKTTGRITASGTTSGPGFLASYITYPEVAYTYKAREQVLQSRNLHWASNFRLTRAGAMEEAARYPAGAEVAVYYDPDFPGTAVLEPGFNRHFAFDIVAGLLIIALAFLAMNAAFAYAAKILMRLSQS